MKNYIPIIMAVVMTVASCSKDETSGTVSYAPVAVDFTLSDPDGLLHSGDEVALQAAFTRDGESVSSVSRYVVSTASGRCTLEAASEADVIYASRGDKDITYTLISPYKEDFGSVPVVEKIQTYGESIPEIITGSISLNSPQMPVNIAVSSRPESAVLAVEIPVDLVAENPVTLSSMTLCGVTMNFTSGLALTENRTVEVAVEPLTIPEGGLPVSFVTTDGERLSGTALSGEDDRIEIKAGKCTNIYIPSIDPFVPCTFPVVFPLGKNPSARTGYYNYSDDQPDWNNRGIWRCFAQKQAYATWNKVSDPHPSYRQRREMVQTGDIGSIGLKGIWTGDYFEFVLPVKDIPAGAKVSFQAPFYGRQQPIFWTVQWLDGQQWKSSTSSLTSWDGSVTIDASFVTKLYGVVIDYGFILSEPIEEGELKVRIICTDGRYQANTQTNTVVTRNYPYIGSSGYESPFYFYCSGSGVNAFTWNIEY